MSNKTSLAQSNETPESIEQIPSAEFANETKQAVEKQWGLDQSIDKKIKEWDKHLWWIPSKIVKWVWWVPSWAKWIFSWGSIGWMISNWIWENVPLLWFLKKEFGDAWEETVNTLNKGMNILKAGGKIIKKTGEVVDDIKKKWQETLKTFWTWEETIRGNLKVIFPPSIADMIIVWWKVTAALAPHILLKRLGFWWNISLASGIIWAASVLYDHFTENQDEQLPSSKEWIKQKIIAILTSKWYATEWNIDYELIADAITNPTKAKELIFWVKKPSQERIKVKSDLDQARQINEKEKNSNVFNKDIWKWEVTRFEKYRNILSQAKEASSSMIMWTINIIADDILQITDQKEKNKLIDGWKEMAWKRGATFLDNIIWSMDDFKWLVASLSDWTKQYSAEKTNLLTLHTKLINDIDLNSELADTEINDNSQDSVSFIKVTDWMYKLYTNFGDFIFNQMSDWNFITVWFAAAWSILWTLRASRAWFQWFITWAPKTFIRMPLAMTTFWTSEAFIKWMDLLIKPVKYIAWESVRKKTHAPRKAIWKLEEKIVDYKRKITQSLKNIPKDTIWRLPWVSRVFEWSQNFKYSPTQVKFYFEWYIKWHISFEKLPAELQTSELLNVRKAIVKNLNLWEKAKAPILEEWKISRFIIHNASNKYLSFLFNKDVFDVWHSDPSTFIEALKKNPQIVEYFGSYSDNKYIPNESVQQYFKKNPKLLKKLTSSGESLELLKHLENQFPEIAEQINEWKNKGKKWSQNANEKNKSLEQTTKNKELRELRERIKALEALVNQNQATWQNNQANVEELNKKLNATKSATSWTIESLREDFKSVQRRLSTWELSITEANNLIKLQESNLNKVNNELKTLETQLKTQVGNTGVERMQVTEEIRTLETQIERIRSYMQNSITENSTRIDEMKTNQQLNLEKIQKANLKIKQAAEAMQNKWLETKQISTQLAESNKQLTRLSAELETFQSEIWTQKTQSLKTIEALTAEIEALKTQTIKQITEIKSWLESAWNTTVKDFWIEKLKREVLRLGSELETINTETTTRPWPRRMATIGNNAINLSTAPRVEFVSRTNPSTIPQTIAQTWAIEQINQTKTQTWVLEFPERIVQDTTNTQLDAEPVAKGAWEPLASSAETTNKQATSPEYKKYKIEQLGKWKKTLTFEQFKEFNKLKTIERPSIEEFAKSNKWYLDYSKFIESRWKSPMTLETFNKISKAQAGLMKALWPLAAYMITHHIATAENPEEAIVEELTIFGAFIFNAKWAAMISPKHPLVWPLFTLISAAAITWLEAYFWKRQLEIISKFSSKFLYDNIWKVETQAAWNVARDILGVTFGFSALEVFNKTANANFDEREYLSRQYTWIWMPNWDWLKNLRWEWTKLIRRKAHDLQDWNEVVKNEKMKTINWIKNLESNLSYISTLKTSWNTIVNRNNWRMTPQGDLWKEIEKMKISELKSSIEKLIWTKRLFLKYVWDKFIENKPNNHWIQNESYKYFANKQLLKTFLIQKNRPEAEKLNSKLEKDEAFYHGIWVLALIKSEANKLVNLDRQFSSNPNN